MITWIVESSQGSEVASAMKKLTVMNEEVVEHIEDKLAKTFHEYIDTRKIYEDELKISHIYKQRI